MRHEPGARRASGTTPSPVTNRGTPFVATPSAPPPHLEVALSGDLARRERLIALPKPFLRQAGVRGGEVVYASKRLLTGAVRTSRCIDRPVDDLRAPVKAATRNATTRDDDCRR